MHDVTEIVEELESWATTTRAPLVGPWPRGEFTFQLGGATLRIKSILHPEFLRNRAARLQKQAKAASRLGTPEAKAAAKAIRWKPSLRRPSAYSKRVAQQFLDDGERENWAAYRELFE